MSPGEELDEKVPIEPGSGLQQEVSFLHPASRPACQLGQFISFVPSFFPYQNGDGAMTVTSLCKFQRDYREVLHAFCKKECKFKAVSKKKKSSLMFSGASG